MITSIVKMRVKPSCLDDFKEFVTAVSDEVRCTEGCTHFDMFNDKKDKTIFFAYTIWMSDKYLDKYRKSEFFKKIWPKIKEYFEGYPMTWTVENILKRK